MTLIPNRRGRIGGAAGYYDLSLSVTATPTYSGTNQTTTRTFSSQSIGAADSNRWIIVAAGGNLRAGGTSLTLDSVTIAGQTATVLQIPANPIPDDDAYAFIAYAKVTTGTTGDIVMNWSGGGDDDGTLITVYRTVTGGNDLLVYDSATDSSVNGTSETTILTSATVDGVAGGFFISAVSSGRANQSVSMSNSNFTEDNAVEGTPCIAAYSYENASEALSEDVEATLGGSTSSGVAGYAAAFYSLA